MSVIEEQMTSFSTTQIEIEQKIISNSSEETQRIGAAFAGKLSPGDVVALFGDLGSGKTTFIKGVCLGLEVAEEITSPTFTLIHEYKGKFPVYHFDFYRVASPNEIFELGCEEYFYGDGITLIEWADRIFDYLPPKRLEVYLKSRFEQGLENSREIRFCKL